VDRNFEAVREVIDRIVRDLAGRPDRPLIERLFEKFKASLNNVAEMMARQSPEARGLATIEDVRRLETILRAMNQEFDEAAAARKSTCCLSCGRPYRTCTGAIQDDDVVQILGAAPISHLTNDVQKPCFVYGTDHELYYSSSPRGKTFVAPPATAPGKSRPKQ
jgi:hypothetical protein